MDKWLGRKELSSCPLTGPVLKLKSPADILVFTQSKKLLGEKVFRTALGCGITTYPPTHKSAWVDALGKPTWKKACITPVIRVWTGKSPLQPNNLGWISVFGLCPVWKWLFSISVYQWHPYTTSKRGENWCIGGRRVWHLCFPKDNAKVIALQSPPPSFLGKMCCRTLVKWTRASQSPV